MASAIADISGLEVEALRDISLSGVFADGDGDALTITASSSYEAVMVAFVAPDNTPSILALAQGTETITVTAQDPDGNRVVDAFDVTAVQAPQPQPEPEQAPSAKYAALIAKVTQWRNDPSGCTTRPAPTTGTESCWPSANRWPTRR